MWYKKAKNAELRGLRFSISFSQMRNELGGKSTTLFWIDRQKSEKHFCDSSKSLNASNIKTGNNE